MLRQQAPGFVTAALARVELTEAGAQIELTTAGHPHPILARADGSAAPIGDVGTPLGIIERPELPEVTATLGPGDLLVFYTDGVSEADAPRRILSEHDLAALVAEKAAEGPRAVVEHLERTAVASADGHPRDDIACLALRVAPPKRVSERFAATPAAAHDLADALAPIAPELGERTAMDLRLLATELVANAVRHTGVEAGTVEVEVRDRPAHRPPERERRRARLRRRRSGRSSRPTGPAAGACTSWTSARRAGGSNGPAVTASGWSSRVITTEALGPGTTLVAVAGEVTFSNVSGLDRALASAQSEATNLVVDLTDVTFIDSSGLSSLITASARARERGGTVALVLAGDEPPSIFRFRGVDRLLALYASREAALAGLS